MGGLSFSLSLLAFSATFVLAYGIIGHGFWTLKLSQWLLLWPFGGSGLWQMVRLNWFSFNFKHIVRVCKKCSIKCNRTFIQKLHYTYVFFWTLKSVFSRLTWNQCIYNYSALQASSSNGYTNISVDIMVSWDWTKRIGFTNL